MADEAAVFLLPMGNINGALALVKIAGTDLSTPYGKHKLPATCADFISTTPFYSLWET